MNANLVNTILQGDCLETLKTLPDKSVDCCVTSPPYFQMRDYGEIPGQIGLEETPEDYINKLVAVFQEVYRVLKDEGTLWLNIGDSYAGSGKGSSKMRAYTPSKMEKSRYLEVPNRVGYQSAVNKPKSLLGIPWRVAFALQSAKWIIRQDIIWAKPSCMPESVKDRFCRSHEHIFLLIKQSKYFFNHEHALEKAAGYDGIEIHTPTLFHNQEGASSDRVPQRGYTTKPNETGLKPQHHGANIKTSALRTKRDVWWITAEPSDVPHHAMFPQKLIMPCVLCGCPENGIVLDPFIGSGTTTIVAKKLLRSYIGCEINPQYVALAKKRIAGVMPLFDGGFSE